MKKRSHKRLIERCLSPDHYWITCLVLASITGLFFYFDPHSSGRISVDSLSGSVASALETCKPSEISEVEVPSDNNSFLLEPTAGSSSLSLQLGAMQLIAGKHFLTAETESGKAEVAVSQPDYGVVNSLHFTQSQEIFALGDQVSYRLKASISENKPVLTTPISLPFLFPESCGLFSRITRSCNPNIAIYSHELNAVFLHGQTSFGSFVSLILGIAPGDLILSNSGTPFFMGDIHGTGNVLLGGPEGFALFNGEEITSCSSGL